MRFLRAFAWVVAFSAATAFAQSATRASDGPWFAPWRVLNAGYERPTCELAVYWLPASRNEIRRAELATSRELTRVSAGCVPLLVVRPDDAALIRQFAGDEALPLVVIADREARVIARVRALRGGVPAEAVASVLRTEIAVRGGVATERLGQARGLAASGDVDGAAAIYRSVAEAGCLLPRQSRLARRALEKLVARK